MKKYLMLALTAVIMLTAVSGSIAFFTESISTDSVITAGNLDIAQHEYERKKNTDGTYAGTLQTYTQKQTVYPVLKYSEERTEEVTVGKDKIMMYGAGMRGFVDKIVTVENIGSLPVYVRTYVAVPARGASEWLHLDKNAGNGWEWSSTLITDVEIGGELYNIHTATNINPLMPGETTAPSLLGFYLDSQFTNKDGSYYFDGKDLGANPELTILVSSKATQAIGYKGEEDKMNMVFTDAYHALDTVFVSDDATPYHPWDGTVIVSTQNEFNTALTNAKYGTHIALNNGEYELPAGLPAGVHLSGWGMDVVVTAKDGNLAATDVELRNVTFGNAVSFTGFGSFRDVAFSGKLTAEISAATLFSACDLKNGCEFTSGADLVSFDEKCALPAGFTLGL